MANFYTYEPRYNSPFFWKINIQICILWMIFLFVKAGATRNLSIQLNPYCEDYSVCNKLNNTLVYVEAVGSKDINHYLWSTESGIPTALIVQTGLNASLQVNWTCFLSSNPEYCISFSESPLYAFGTLLTKILQFNDTDDTADMMNCTVKALDFLDVIWHLLNETSNSSDHCSVTFQTENTTQSFLSEGSISLQLTTYNKDGHGKKFPHLIHNSNNVEIGIILDNLLVSDKTSRFAFEFVAVYNDGGDTKDIEIERSDNLDDEYSPGVFTTVDLLTSTNCSQVCDGYMFWKPIAYSDTGYTVSHSTDVRFYDIVPQITVPPGIMKAYFGSNKTVHISSWNISFGTPKDKFYNNTRYTSWNFVVGVGKRPIENPSLMLILTIAIGFGAPFACVVIGSIYMGIRKLTRKDDDDLLLSRDSM